MYNGSSDEAENPLDAVERFLIGIDQPGQRLTDNELAVAVRGERCAYHAMFSHDRRNRILMVVLSFEIGLHQHDVDANNPHMTQMYRLLAECNRYNRMGHFELWPDEHAIVWRYSVPCPDFTLTDQSIDFMLHTGKHTCDKFFPAFAQVLWGGRNANDLLQITLAEPWGNA